MSFIEDIGKFLAKGYITDIEGQRDRCFLDRDSLSKHNYELKIQNDAIEKEVKECEGEINDLTQNIDSLQADVEEIGLELAKYQDVPKTQQVLDFFAGMKDKSDYIFGNRRFFSTKDQGNLRCPIDARKLFCVGDSRMIELAQSIQDRYGSTTEEQYLLDCARFIANEVKYLFEYQHWGFNDFWPYASEVFLHDFIGSGKHWGEDCEGKSIAFCSLVLNGKYLLKPIKVPSWRVHVGFGYCYGGGHAFVIFNRPNDLSMRIFESTNSNAPDSLNLRYADFSDSSNPYDLHFTVGSKEIYAKKDIIYGSEVNGRSKRRYDKSVLKGEKFLQELIKKRSKSQDTKGVGIKREYEAMLNE